MDFDELGSKIKANKGDQMRGRGSVRSERVEKGLWELCGAEELCRSWVQKAKCCGHGAWGRVSAPQARGDRSSEEEKREKMLEARAQAKEKLP